MDDLKDLSFGEKVRALRLSRGLTQLQLAELSGISQNAIVKIEKGGDTAQVVELAKALDVSPAFLKLGDGDAISYQASLRPIALWDREDELDADQYVFIPALEIKLSAGPGNQIWHIDEKGQRQAFTRKWAERVGVDPNCAATMVIDGDSMEPRYLDGDSVVVDYCQRNTIVDGKVYAISIDGEVFIKRLFKELSGAVRIVSDNPDKSRHPDKHVPPEYMDKLQIIGRVVALAGAAV
ncbi:S24 family peptidase [Aquitalea sp. USM4]|uniref:XRE family transcriptional regulator n=1 Tax=Aquitalea sp. USM4 TaxID=1590041 RepID=UPI001040D2D3|nr:S24 family peptidase [Aquitalea sp. USM4]QBJ80537.1 phage repressor protein [Aquitalea sp. USM4]